MQPVSRQQLNRNKYVRITSFEGKNDSFRIAKGDAALIQRQQQQPQQPMASAVDRAGSGPAGAGADTSTEASAAAAGKMTPESSSTTVFLHPPDATMKTADQDGEHSSSSSKLPTHPACQRATSAPSSSPAVALTDRKPSPSTNTSVGTAGTTKLEMSPRRGAGGAGKVEKRRVLGNVDTNVLAVLSNETSDGDGQQIVEPTPKEAASKKRSRRSKSKKANGVDGASAKNNNNNNNNNKVEAPPTKPTSYAEAVKEDPVVAEKRQVKDQASELSIEPREKAQKNGTDHSKPTPAGDLTFAHAVEDGFADSKATSEISEAQQTCSDNPVADKSEQLTTAPSEGSTFVEYPEIPSDPHDAEEEQRRRDKEKAAVLAGARWAPLGVPIKRRIQTAAVLMHCVIMGLTLSIFFGFCAVPIFWPIIILYLFSILFSTAAHDGKLSRRNERVRRLAIWKYFAEYFPAKLHKTHDLLPTRKYILGYHPHGIISHGAWAAFATDALGFSEKFPGITNCLVTLESNFHLPFYREYVLSMGLQSVSKQAITNILTRGGRNNEGMGRAATIVIGGARESLGAQPRTMRLVIKERKGFIKLALQTGADLVPVLAFGENDLYDQLDPHEHPWLHGLQRYFLKAWKFTVPLLHGRGIFNYDVGLMPYRRPLNIVVGKPIPVVQAGNPDNIEINRLHELYVEELQKIWDRYKDEFAGHRKEEMQFMD